MVLLGTHGHLLIHNKSQAYSFPSYDRSDTSQLWVAKYRLIQQGNYRDADDPK